MTNRRTLRYILIACGALAAVVITVSVLRGERKHVTLAASGAPVMRGAVPAAGSSGKFTMEKMELWSDSYRALPEVRAKLIAEVQAANTELQAALANPPVSNEQVSRGVYVYLPPQSDHFNRELKSFYLSVAVMRTTQPAHLKTDLVVFTPTGGMDFAKSLGCVEDRRETFADPERCTVVEHVPLAKRSDPYDPLSGYANYIDSMLVLAEYSGTHAFTYVIRSDLDTFLTPGFSNWVLPDGKVIATGRGGYGSRNANLHLTWVMQKRLGLQNRNVGGVGSTWYGESRVMQATAKVCVTAMRWLHTQEFSEFEQFHAGTESWPNWHWPVMLLYGGHIALNQIPTERAQPHSPGVMELDHGSDGPEPLVDSTKHIHCWHSNDFFSKLRFQMHQYDHTDISEHAGMESRRAYAGMIAISSDRLQPEELANYIADPGAMQRRDWMRTVNTEGL